MERAGSKTAPGSARLEGAGSHAWEARSREIAQLCCGRARAYALLELHRLGAGGP